MTCPPWVISARPMATRRRAAIRAGSISLDHSSEPTARAASDGHTEALGDRPSSKDSKEASSCRSTSPMPCLRQLSEHQRTESQSRAQTLRQVMLRPHRAQGLDGRAGRVIPEVCPEDVIQGSRRSPIQREGPVSSRAPNPQMRLRSKVPARSAYVRTCRDRRFAAQAQAERDNSCSTARRIQAETERSSASAARLTSSSKSAGKRTGTGVLSGRLRRRAGPWGSWFRGSA